MSEAAVAASEAGRLRQAVTAGAAATVAGALLLGATQGGAGERALELGYWALALGLLIGAAIGTAGERTRSAALLAVPLALIGVVLTQVTSAAVYLGTADAGAAFDFWRAEILGKNDMTFYFVAAIEGYLVAQRVAEMRAKALRA